jgi:hypothetical protein
MEALGQELLQIQQSHNNLYYFKAQRIKENKEFLKVEIDKYLDLYFDEV